MTANQKTVLHVGCGPQSLRHLPPGFGDGSWREVRFDIDPRHNPDIVGTIVDMANVPDGSMDALYSSHNLEHVFGHEVPRVLAEFRRVLKPDGFAIVLCPDLQGLGEQITAGRLTEPLYISGEGPISVLDILYGHSASIERGQHYMAHKTGFTQATLHAAFKTAGFSSVAVGRRGIIGDLWSIAYRGLQTRERLDADMAALLPSRLAVMEYESEQILKARALAAQSIGAPAPAAQPPLAGA